MSNPAQKKSQPSISFEIFPYEINNNEKEVLNRFHRLYENLLSLEPKFCSLTYGASGSLQSKSEIILKEMLKYQTKVYAHITIINKTKNELREIIKRWHDLGVYGFVVIRGDVQSQTSSYSDNLEKYNYVFEFIEDLRLNLGNGSQIAVGCYPETHPLAKDQNSDILHLIKKFEAGANFALSQFFFDAKTFLDFKQKVLIQTKCEYKILPGIIPIYNYEKIVSFAKKCNTKIPTVIDEKFSKLNLQQVSKEVIDQAIISNCLELCQNLISAKVDHLHFYTLNLSKVLNKIITSLKS